MISKRAIQTNLTQLLISKIVQIVPDSYIPEQLEFQKRATYHQQYSAEWSEILKGKITKLGSD